VQSAASDFAAGAIAYNDASRLEAFTPDELIVTFKPGAVGAPAIGARAMAQGATAQAVGAAIRSRLAPHASAGRAEVTGVSPAILAARLRVPDVGRLAEVASVLRGDPAVAVVERNGLVRRLEGPPAARPSSITPSAFGYPFQSWHYGMVDLPEAWSITTGSAAVLVAVVDDGIRFDHPDIAANLTADGRDFVSNTKYRVCGTTADSIGNAGDSDGYDADPTIPASYGFDPFADCVTPAEPFGGHGLHVAGTIGALGSQVAIGANWTVRIRPVRALGVTGFGSEYDVAQGILYAAGLPADNGAGGTVQAGSAARIINMSLGAGQASAILQNAIVSAHGAGVLLVASAGNSSTSDPSYPAAYPEVLSVAALGPDGQPTSYSNFGATIDLAAPGGDFADAAPGDEGNVFGSFGVLSTGWDFQDAQPTWFFAAGTSMAAPHVSGVAALLLAHEPGLSRDDLRTRLTTYAVDSGAAGRDDLYGYGIVNARNSLTQSFAPPQGLYVRLYDASTGRIVRTVAAQPDGAYAFNALPDGSYHVFAGQDESGDGIVGVPGRRWGAFGGEPVPTAVAVSGAGVYPGSFTIGFPLEAESNSTLAQANVLHPGGYLHGAVDAPGSLDYLRVRVPTPGQYTFETSGWDGACGLAMEENTVLRLYDAGGVLIASHHDIDAAAFLYCSRITTSLAAGTYYLSVDGTRGRRYRVQARADF
jgi:serine protease